MIVYSNPGIKSLGATRLSSVVSYGQSQYCIAEVTDGFNPTDKQMTEAKIDFWYPVVGSHVDGSQYKLRKYEGGIVYGIYDQLNLTKERNIAYGIYAISSERKADVWQVWERSILKESKECLNI